jgi:hypothetical protein
MAIEAPAFEDTVETEAPVTPPAFDDTTEAEAPISAPAFEDTTEVTEPASPEQSAPNTFGDKASRVMAGSAEMGTAILGGAVRKFTMDFPQLASLADEVAKATGALTTQEFMDAMQGAGESAETDYGANPKQSGNFLSTVAKGAGSLIPTLASGPFAPYTSMLGMGEIGYRDAEAKGATEEQKKAAFTLNSAVGVVTEKFLGLPALLKSAQAAKVPEKTFSALVKTVVGQAAKGFVREGSQETLEQVSSDTIAAYLAAYDSKREVFDPKKLATTFLAGGIIGAPLAGTLSLVANTEPEQIAPIEEVRQADQIVDSAIEEVATAEIPTGINEINARVDSEIEQTIAGTEIPANIEEINRRVDQEVDQTIAATEPTAEESAPVAGPAAVEQTPEEVAPEEQVVPHTPEAVAEPASIAPQEQPAEATSAEDPAQVENPPESTGSDPAGIRNAIVDEQREKRGLPPREAPAKRTFGSLWEGAQETARKDHLAGSRLVTELKDATRPVTDAEDALLTHEQVARQNAFDQAMSDLNTATTEEQRASATSRLTAARDAVQEVYDVGQSVGTANARGLNARRMLVNDDFSLARMEATKRAIENEGRPLTPQQQAEVKALHDEITSAQKRITELESREKEREATSTFAALRKESTSEARKAAKAGKGFSDFLNEQAAKAEKRIRERRGKLYVSIDVLNIAGLIDEAIIGASKIAKGLTKFSEWSAAMLKDFGDNIRPHLQPLFEQSKAYHDTNEKVFKGTPVGETKARSAMDRAQANAAQGNALDGGIVYDLAREKVNAGMQGLDEVMAAVHADLAPLHEGVTVRDVRDAFSDYGKVQFPSKAEDLAKLREFRRLGQLVSAIEDAQKKQPPKKTGMQRDQPTQAIREKMKELQAAMREAGIESEGRDQLKSTNAARITQLQNQIADLDKQLRTGDKPTAKQAAPVTPEVERLRAERDAMKAELDRIQAEANPPISSEQKALNDALIARERWDRILRGEESPSTKESREALSQMEADIRAEIDSMKDQAAEMRREAKRDPNAADHAKIKALEKATAEYERRVRDMDFSNIAKKPMQGPQKEAVSKAQAAKDAAKKAFDALREAQKPKLTEEERRLTRDKASIRRQIEKLESKIKAGDYTRPEKKDHVSDKEKAELQFRLDKAKEKFNRGLFEAQLAKRSTGKKILHGVRDTLNFAKSIMTSLDLSAVLRQGGFISLAQPVRAAGIFPTMFRAFVSEQAQHASQVEISKRENAPLYKQAKLFLSDPNDYSLSKMEENYMSRWIGREEIGATDGTLKSTYKRAKNLLLAPTRASARAYTAFLNRLRADSFDAMLESLRKGSKPTLEEAKAIANFVNIATGRGKIGAAGRATPELNAVFFAPRLVASRFQLLAGQPFYGGTARTRGLIAKEYGRYLIGMGVIYALASLARDDDDPPISFDPRSSDFGKLRFGDTRLDPLSGLAQATVVTNRVAQGETVKKGEVVPLRGDDVPYGGDDTYKVLAKFARTKFSPSFGAAVNIATGKDVNNKPTTAAREIGSLFVPLSMRDVLTVMEEQGVPKGTAINLLQIFGMGLQHHEDRR